MKSKQAAVARKQLDRRLTPLRSQEEALVRPRAGWIRAIRDALGMTSAELGRRMGIAQATVSNLEKSEAEGGITLKSLRSAAEALDCTLVYALVPRRPLEEQLRRRARAVAERNLARTHHTMSLENQALSPAELEIERERLVEEILREDLRLLWREENSSLASRAG